MDTKISAVAAVEVPKGILTSRQRIDKRGDFLASLRGLSLGELAYCKPLLTAVAIRLAASEIKEAYQTIDTYPAPTDAIKSALEDAKKNFPF